MRHLNQVATRIFECLVQGLQVVGDSKTIANNDSFMSVIVEFTGTYGEASIFSVSHYGEQNGDLMCDPDMTFLLGTGGQVYPLSYRNDYAGVDQIAVRLETSSKIRFNEKLQYVLVGFAQDWFRSINDQKDLGVS